MPLSSAFSDTVILGIGMPGVGELVLILLIVLVIFGAGKLPQIGDALGKSIRNFRKETKGTDDPDKPIESDRRLSEGSSQSVERVEEVEAHDVTPPKSRP